MLWYWHTVNKLVVDILVAVRFVMISMTILEFLHAFTVAVQFWCSGASVVLTLILLLSIFVSLATRQQRHHVLKLFSYSSQILLPWYLMKGLNNCPVWARPIPSPLIPSLHHLLLLSFSIFYVSLLPFLTRLIYFLDFPSLPILPE